MNKVLSVILIAVILVTIGTLGCTTGTSQAEEKYTEFYILGLDGKATDYPKELSVGENGRVIVGIINREHQMVNYQVQVIIDDATNNQVGAIELAHNEKWEEIVSFTPDRVGDNQKVEFLLYKSGDSEPYLKLHLWIDVKEVR